jgi:phosphotransferase system  glucose/maltose/N-acetylglucosamine-specific IIC component
MWLILIPLSFIALAFLLYFAISKKSSPMVRRLAVIALILAAMALVVSAIFIVTASPQEAEPGPVTLPLPAKPSAAAPKVIWYELVGFCAFFLLFLLFLFALSRRNRPTKTGEDGALKKRQPEEKRF